ncbi:MAG: hypothetical protein PHD97_07940 [Bacteroidales bacterium]|nr:hypothetical protein [Bacteroidales bacterium]
MRRLLLFSTLFFLIALSVFSQNSWQTSIDKINNLCKLHDPYVRIFFYNGETNVLKWVTQDGDITTQVDLRLVSVEADEETPHVTFKCLDDSKCIDCTYGGPTKITTVTINNKTAAKEIVAEIKKIASLKSNKTSDQTVSKCIAGDCEEGSGTYVWGSSSEYAGDKYVGEWKNGKMDGYGTYYHANGDKYVGDWKDGHRNGQGTFYFITGEKYTGEWKDSKRNGYGTNTYTDGKVETGEWKDNKFLGATNPITSIVPYTKYDYTKLVTDFLNLWVNSPSDADVKMRKYISPSYIKSNYIDIDDYEVNNYVPTNFEIIDCNISTGKVKANIWGNNKSLMHSLIFKIVEENGTLYFYPSKKTESYIYPWDEVIENFNPQSTNTSTTTTDADEQFLYKYECYKMVQSFLNNWKNINDNAYAEMRKYIPPSYIRNNNLNSSDFKVNNYSIYGFKIFTYDTKKEFVKAYVWGENKSWIHEVVFQIIEENGKLYFNPSEIKYGYVYPWYSVKTSINEK